MQSLLGFRSIMHPKKKQIPVINIEKKSSPKINVDIQISAIKNENKYFLW